MADTRDSSGSTVHKNRSPPNNPSTHRPTTGAAAYQPKTTSSPPPEPPEPLVPTPSAAHCPLRKANTAALPHRRRPCTPRLPTGHSKTHRRRQSAAAACSATSPPRHVRPPPPQKRHRRRDRHGRFTIEDFSLNRLSSGIPEISSALASHKDARVIVWVYFALRTQGGRLNHFDPTRVSMTSQNSRQPRYPPCLLKSFRVCCFSLPEAGRGGVKSVW